VFEAPRLAVVTVPVAPIAPVEHPQPLDATRLPKFDGEHQVVKESLRGVARIDLTAPTDDLWQRIRNGFSMPNLDSPLVDEKTAYYAARPEYLKRMFERSRRYMHHIVQELERRGMPTELALLPMVESAFNPLAYSPAHASGLWQFIPGTGRTLRIDAELVVRRATRHRCVDQRGARLPEGHLRDAWRLAPCPRLLQLGRKRGGSGDPEEPGSGLPGDYSSLAMPAETRNYVPKLQALKNIIANPQPFGIALDPIPNQPYFATFTKTRDIDVQLAARLAEMPVEEFVALNPGFNRPLIPVAVNSRIVLPTDKIEVFRANLLKHDEKALVSWQAYQPKKGDSIESLAKKFGMTVGQLKEVNGIAPRTRVLPALLVVPVNGAAVETKRMPIMYAPPIPAPGQRTLTHTVKLGDTLPAIAQRYRVSVEDLRQSNKIGRLAVGQKLTVQAQTRGAPQKSQSRTPTKGKPKQAKPGKPVKRS
jgi:membrane-bound lytic murein transglycosylase D